MEMQNQIHQNSDEHLNFLKDLDNWEINMRKKEEEMKLIQISEDDDLPPIRNYVYSSKKKCRGKKKKEKSSPIKTNPISAYNYDAWEKFDVESELKKIEEEQKDSTSSDSSSSEEKVELMKRQQLAIIKKDKGNDFFKNGNYDSAINCYSAGMELDPENPLLFANRAMAFLKKEQYQAAENDCTQCLKIDPTYVKAYLRRGNARMSLQKLILAKEDFLKVLELEPGNKGASFELEKIKKVEDENSYELKKNSEKFCNEKNIELSTTKILFEDDKGKEFIVNDGTNEVTAESNIISKEPNTTEISKSLEDPLKEIENVISTLEQSLPPIPTASFQFLTDWKTMSKYPDLKYRYLKQFPPERFHSVFKHSMEVELFPDIINIISTYFIDNGDDVYKYMRNLPKVGRFETTLMFLSKEERKGLEKVLNFIKCSKLPTSEIEELIKLYKF